MTVLMGAELNAMAAANLAALTASGSLRTIRGGTFMMGADEKGDEWPIHEVSVDTFRMGIDDVTNEEYRRFVSSLGNNRFALIGAHPVTGIERVLALGSSEFEVIAAVEKTPASQLFPWDGNLASAGAPRLFPDFKMLKEIVWRDPRPGFGRPRQPIVEINWYEAFVFAFLHGCMLPTEEQWEFAARVTVGQGNDAYRAAGSVIQGNELRTYATRSDSITREEVNYEADTTVDVDERADLRTLENGLRQMVGNVWRWLQDWYEFDAYSKRSSVKHMVYKNIRGGGFDVLDPWGLHASRRRGCKPGAARPEIGVRLAAPAQPALN